VYLTRKRKFDLGFVNVCAAISAIAELLCFNWWSLPSGV